MSIDTPPQTPAPGRRSLPNLDVEVPDSLLRAGRFFRKGEISKDLRTIQISGGREADSFYRERASYDKVVRSTHGVNCTGSCSWKVYVKDGIITWESQQTDYPSIGADKPEYEPRGCPRGASFSWYTYSPTRVKYPYVRGRLLELFREAKEEHGGDPVLAWQSIVNDPYKSRLYKQSRGRGGFVRATWEEAVEIVAAANVSTIKDYGPDRIVGFSPIPAMSMVSHASGARFVSMIGGAMLSFYDWYADLPVASPQVFGDQTDVPESADWFDASYLVMWGSNVPVTRTPDAHYMTEARYRGQKVVVVSPDYADNVKFADEWLPAQPGTDGALAMAMGHVILKEFYVDRTVPYFHNYAKQFTDLPNLITLVERDGKFVPGKFLTASDLGDAREGSEFRTVILNDETGEAYVPNGSLGDRFTESGMGKWNLELEGVEPRMSLYGTTEDVATILVPRFDEAPKDGQAQGAGILERGVPTTLVAGADGTKILVTTVLDLMLAQYGVGRDGLPGVWPQGYDDPTVPYTPAWQEAITGVPAAAAERIGREFAANAEKSNGRSMILMGAGTNHWFHSDATYRTFLALTTLTGCQGVNGGGWAHYVGQEKCRPVTGWAQLAYGLDWNRPPRQQAGTPFWYLNTDQWRYDGYSADAVASPLAEGKFANRHTADLLIQAAKSGWMPSYPSFNRNSLDLADEAEASGKDAATYVVDQLKSGDLKFACEDPDAPENFPRVLTVWRANLLGSSAKGNEYWLKHLLGTTTALRADETPEELRPNDVTWREDAPIGKLDLMLSLDFRMTSTTLFSDVVLPAATWYEKHDLSSTDMHPFVHSFNPAINPPWETKTDFSWFNVIAKAFSSLAKDHLGVRKDLVAVPLMHDTADAMANPKGEVKDWSKGECEPIPGKTMPKLIVVERDYGAIAEQMGALGPLLDTLGVTTKGITMQVGPEIERLKKTNGVVRGGIADGRPLLTKDTHAAETILALSGTTNGRLAVHGFEVLEKRTGTHLAELARDDAGKKITFADTQARPVAVITSPEWSGSEHGGRRYSPFTINLEHKKPWHTLTGRQHFFLDHDWMHEMGEELPTFRPPLNMHQLFAERTLGENDGTEVTVRYITPHSKWSIHSAYQDNLHMLTLSRGGPTIWMSVPDAEKVGIKDNDWIEAVNRNGVVVARAIVSHKMPEGTVYMYHVQERYVAVPRAHASGGKRGGTHNSLTRVLIKPTHLIGGYGQQSFALNYHGPTGNQRDEVTTIRKRSQEVEW